MSSSPPLSPTIYKFIPWIAATAFFMQSLDTSILNTALPAIAQDLNESPLNMQSAIISYVLTLALFIPVSGVLADKLGTRNVFVLAVFLFLLGSIACALSPSLIWFDVGRIIQGMGGSMMVPVSRLVIIKSFKRSELLSALNNATIPGLIGPIIGPILGGYLVQMMSWHWIFLINLPIGLVGIITALKFMPNLYGKSHPFDIIGVLLVSSAAMSVTLGLELINDNLTYLVLLLFVFAGIGLFYYLQHARRTLYPIFPLALFNIHTFRIGIMGNLISRLGISATPFLVPLLLQIAFGYSAIQSGILLLPMAVAALIMRTWSQRILNRFGYRHVLIYNTLFAGLAIIALSLLQKDSSIIVYIILLFALGFFNSLQFTAMNSITLSNLEGDLTSSGNSLMAVNQQLAVSFGVALGAVLVQFFSQHVDLFHHDVDKAFKISFILLGLITCGSVLIFSQLKATDGRNLIKHR